ncbi:phosphatidylserine/phosphatidylglycerophosphate/cardiolipin synthase family protein [Candidatus Peribacteria bacterium]|nr:phosphatidylserine/phosphatidylglycerophosphate/cardiolipin synthase family protein [Candidatus Peribacteria bacterium]
MRGIRSLGVRGLQLLVMVGLVLLLGRYMLGGDTGQGALHEALPGGSSTQTGPFTGELFFNNQLESTVMTRAILPLIEQAQQSIAVAMYSFTYPQLHTALNAAVARGVSVTLVLDPSRQEAFDAMTAAYGAAAYRVVSAHQETERSLMHQKFWIFDGVTLAFGSWNATLWQQSYDPSMLLVTRYRPLVEALQIEFTRLAEGQGTYRKLRQTGYQPLQGVWQTEDGDHVELWLSPGVPGNSLQQRVLELLRSAAQRIDIAVWRLNDREVAAEIVRAAERGVTVRILVDDHYAEDSDSVVDGIARRHHSNIMVHTDAPRTPRVQRLGEVPADFNPYIHQHTIMVDGETALSGTNNWSFAGYYRNDESAILSDAPWWVAGLGQSFDQLWEESAPLTLTGE